MRHINLLSGIIIGMSLPVIAIIGKPNVGKSTLFNRIVRSRTSIVEDVPGVTRDRLYREASWDDRKFIVIDTGGFLQEGSDEISKQTMEQAFFAINEADSIIMLFDGRDGLTEVDREITAIIRRQSKKVYYAVNKIDSKSREDLLAGFYSLGVEEILPISAATGYGITELMERIIDDLPGEKDAGEVSNHLPRIAIVGKPNVGKSTLVNALLGKERMIVSPRPGTTRDSVDSICSYYGKRYTIIDTAGVRRKSRINYSVERFMVVRALKSIERSDVALLLIDSTDGISDQDQRIAGIIEDFGKGIIILFNKWDLVEEPEKYYRVVNNQIQRKLYFADYAAVLTVSGLTRRRITKVFPLIDRIMEARKTRIATAELNRIVPEINPLLPTVKGRRVKIRYITQTGTEPPEFTVFLNSAGGLKPQHVKFLERRLREKYPFYGTPIRINIRQAKSRKV